MIGALTAYAQAHNLCVQPGFTTKAVRWGIVLSTEGGYAGVVELGEADQKKNPGLEFPMAPNLSQPEMKAAGITKSHFLVEAAEVVALYGPRVEDAREGSKVRDKHRYFAGLLSQAAAVMPVLAHAAGALADDAILTQLRDDLAARKARPTDKVTFQIGGSFPVAATDWHEWWQQFRSGLPVARSKAGTLVCFATGELVEPANTHPKITGLADVGGSSMGAPLIGFDKEAFESYGLRQSANAAMGEQAAAAYRSALNHIVAHHSERLLGAKVAHWFRRTVKPEHDPFAFLFAPPADEEQAVQQDTAQTLAAQQHCARFLRGVRDGEITDLTGNEYYALSLSGAAGRVMVRDWMKGRFETLADNVLAWFTDLEIVHRDGGRRAPWPKFLAVLGATARDLDDVPVPLAAEMWRVALQGQPLPARVLARAVARVRVDIIADSPFNHARMGLIKAYHLRQARQQGGSPMPKEQLLQPELNEHHPESAYHCGRLMAVLAALQRSALGDIGAGIVQRYYAAASSTPALVLGRLERLSKFHLAKLDSPKLAWWYEDKLASIWGRIKDTVPRTLTLEQQSLFAMGYYQQLADLRTRKSAASADGQTDQSQGENEHV